MADRPPFNWPNGKRAALSISFDDARPSQLDNGIEILDQYGLAGTFYVLPDMVRSRLAGWEKVVAAGHEIGNHTVTHPCSGNYTFSRSNALEHYTLERLERDELLAANDAIEELLATKPRTFAYPCAQRFVGVGEQTQSYVPLVARHFIVGRGGFDEVPNDPTICDLAQITSLDIDGAGPERLRSLVQWALDEGRWLVLAGHDVGDSTPQSVPPSSLEALCRYARELQVELWVDTVVAVGWFLAEQRDQGRSKCW
ncbi:MAG TPA: polysaccharide deacetylase family protein [Mycobacterium sp.]|jgi:peptidoglycan-N-acetylglucosamine deacetylase|uniref:polysaccharide deacetylase family protein n=1 Tax=Mycobacterium sp. TaxID=1785 RepID=UPI002D497E1C|nr:polysaccharide deacetylase family protein [Mycobacterium sp.]HZU46657.1 polysaccharide deacetylase family protein [Mycobacterium sp.]